MPTTVVRPFRGVSAQDRRAQRRVDLIEAAFDVAHDVGLAKLTMTAVCERAELTQRYFYEHFRNRDELVRALYDTVFDEFFGRARAATDAQPPDDLFARAKAALDVVVDFFTADDRKRRVFIEAQATPEVAEHKADATRRFVEYATDQAISAYSAPTPRQRIGVALAASIFLGGSSDAVAPWLAGQIDLPRDEFVNEMARLFVAAIAAARDAN